MSQGGTAVTLKITSSTSDDALNGRSPAVSTNNAVATQEQQEFEKDKEQEAITSLQLLSSSSSSSSVTPSPHASSSSGSSSSSSSTSSSNNNMEMETPLSTNNFNSEDTPNLNNNQNSELHARVENEQATASSPRLEEGHSSSNGAYSNGAVSDGGFLAVESSKEEEINTAIMQHAHFATSDDSASEEKKDANHLHPSAAAAASTAAAEVTNKESTNNEKTPQDVAVSNASLNTILNGAANDTVRPTATAASAAALELSSAAQNKKEPALMTTQMDVSVSEKAAETVSTEEQSTDDVTNTRQQSVNHTNTPTAVPQKRASPVVIDLLDSDDDDDDDDNDEDAKESTTSSSNQDIAQQAIVQHIQDRKRQKVAQNPIITTEAALASQLHRAAHMPQWMKQPIKQPGVPIQPGMSLPGPAGPYSKPGPLPPPPPPPPGVVKQHPPAAAAAAQPPQPEMSSQHRQALYKFNTPFYLRYPEGFVPTWEKLLPDSAAVKPQQKRQRRAFRLSLLNVGEFTIDGLPLTWEGPPTPVAGLRKAIKGISRDHGKAVYEKNREGGGRWRIPLGAYHSFLTFLKSDPLTIVEGIPQNQLQIASLERARQEKGYPTAEKLMEQGMPAGLAKALAPFQRGGVDFVLSKGGRALIADDMGLGKTIQGIASMAMYHQDWPLLVLCPSSARYHWENEFQQWLGVNSPINEQQNDGDDEAVSDAADDISRSGALLEDSQIHVLTAAKDDVLPTPSTRVVICSYGLAPALVESGKIAPSTFPCAIVDESHMLKNKSTKRTSTLLPFLSATHRCVLLSGTPALARPAELWPQLDIIGVAKYGWWDSEAEFMEKYTKSGGPRRLAELHTMLTGTVMIRRLKADILKDLPKKIREKAELNILTHDQRHEFKEMMMELRQGKGALGQIAREEHAKASSRPNSTVDDSNALSANTSLGQACTGLAPDDSKPDTNENSRAIQESKAFLDQRLQTELLEGRNRIQASLVSNAAQLPPDECNRLAWQLDGQLLADLENKRRQGIQEIEARFGQNSQVQNKPEQESKRTTLLSRLYERTGNAKIPLLVDMLKRWLNDPLKGKLCIFAHHISVLNAIRDMAGLSNEEGSKNKFIRIDGSTSPKLRQQQIKAFQTDHSTRIALLGITAAGVSVNLTASSTVWFAELFWTPAIMVQAEDRCHRIGQQAHVRCLYFVARGTIDDVLWRLIEKKFSDLGEFVEGKEKLKIVVDKTYNKLGELHEIFSDATAEDDEPGDLSDSDSGLDEDLLDPDLVHAIEALGEEEKLMLRSTENEDESPDSANTDSQTEIVTILEEEVPSGNQGRSEEDAIALLDDEDGTSNTEMEASVTKGEAEEKGAEAKPTTKATTNQSSPSDASNLLSSLNKFSLYKLFIPGPKLGVVVAMFAGRLVVSGVSEKRIKLLGADARPRVGDIFCAINEVRIPRSPDFQQLMQWLRGLINMQQGFASCVFAEEPTFAAYYLQHHAQKDYQPKAQEKQPPSEPKNDEIIEID